MTAPLLVRPPSSLLVYNRYLRVISSRYRLSWRRPVLLFDVALRWLPDVLCRRAGGHVRVVVSDYHHGHQAVARVGMEGAEFVGCAGRCGSGWGCLSCCELGPFLNVWWKMLIDRRICTTTKTGSLRAGNWASRGSTARLVCV